MRPKIVDLAVIRGLVRRYAAARSSRSEDSSQLLDSGIRSGSDVLIALALGADACLVGRPYVYGLAISSADGVSQVIENIVAELDLTLGLLGIPSIAALSADVVVPAQ